MDATVAQSMQQWANDLLVWVGFGTLVGLAAKALMPGRDAGGALATLLMGIGGTVIGCSMLMFLTNGQRVTPISPLGFFVATAGAFLLLGFARVFGSRVTRTTSSIPRPHRRRRATTPVASTLLDE